MVKKINLSIIILNYNTKDLLRQCLESVIRDQKSVTSKKPTTNHPALPAGRRLPTTEVIVVDNASKDNSVSMMREKFPQLELIVNKKNIGFAAGNNKGIKKSRGRYILFLNPDTIVQPDTLRVMVDFMDNHSQVGAATCRVELPNGELDYSCHRGFPTPWNALAYFSGLAKIFPRVKTFTGYTLTYLPLEKIHEIDSACGAFLIVRREAGKEIGWWDEDYFWYGEDLDFSYRLKQKGWQIMFVPKVKIIHYKGAASGIKKHTQEMTTATKKTKIRAVKASTEVMRIFFKKHYQDKYPRFIYWLVIRGIDLLERIRLFKHSL